AVSLIGSGIIGWSQADKAQKLAALNDSLNGRQVALDHAQANTLAELSTGKLSHNDFDSALRLAARGTRIDLALDRSQRLPGSESPSRAAVALADAVSQADWRFALGGHDGRVLSAAFSPDGSRIVTASGDKTARIWEEVAVPCCHESAWYHARFPPDESSPRFSGDGWRLVSAKEIAVLRGHDAGVYSAAFSPDGSRIVTDSED